jgi:Membrane carboxypeptidase (penicillin-binding protein)
MAKEKTASKKSAKAPKKTKTTRSRVSKASKSGMSLYSNLAYKRRVKADERARKKAEELAKLPKNPVLRFFARLRPDRVLKWWFSKEGQLFFLKCIAAIILLIIIGIGGLFLYFKKDLAEIDPEELASRVQNTVNTYLDRNGELLWEDRGSGDYRLVVDGSDISTYMRQATVAIEDKNFYNHPGVDISAIFRAAYVTLVKRGAVQGGSTLTQQLIKQVYFSDEASNRDASGIPRKIKEIILAIEVEKMYDKEQIITLYLNESPYGGRRNGVESAAQTYFGKSAKDLNLPESALLAAIPNNPAVLNPYNTYGNDALVARQHKVLDSMVEMGYITESEAKEAKDVDIIAQIKPEQDQYVGMKAPWFVLEVKSQLEAKFGIKTMREGGFVIKTTLDLRAQNIAEQAVASGVPLMRYNGSDNAALVSVDVETSQVISMVGSIDWNKQGYGQVNATTSLLEPGSTIKPLLDYGPLFMERNGVNYGPGSILADENIDRIYCRGTVGSCRVRNASNRFYGNVTIRQALASSLNIPAIKALYINGIENSLPIAHALGDVSYCANGEQAGLSMAIGGGCAVRPVEHANAYASLARGGVYKDLAYWLEIKNSNGDVIDSWTDSEGKRAINEQVAYMLTSILSDTSARGVMGVNGRTAGYYSPNTWYAAKTGTSDNGKGKAKDGWIATYSTVLATVIWNGNHDGRALTNGNYSGVKFTIAANYMDRVHNEVYAADGKWKRGDKINAPAGIQTLTINGKTDIWGSWMTKSKSNYSSEEFVFDTYTHKKASECTPDETKQSVKITKIIDPMTNNTIYSGGDWKPEETDDVHKCTDVRPTASIGTPTVLDTDEEGNPTSWRITGSASYGTYELSSYSMSVGGTQICSGALSTTGGSFSCNTTIDPAKGISLRVVDKVGYAGTAKR